MQGFRSGLYYCNRKSLMASSKNVVSPPTKKVLVRKFKLAVLTHSKTSRRTGITKHRLPNSQWLIDNLYQLDPKDEIFDKSYTAPVRQARGGVQVDNDDHFFEGLPKSKSSHSKRSLMREKATK